MVDMKKKKRPEQPPERPIEITKLIDKYAEEGRLPLSFGGKYLSKGHAGTGAIKLDLRAIGPDVEKKKTEKEAEIIDLSGDAPHSMNFWKNSEEEKKEKPAEKKPWWKFW